VCKSCNLTSLVPPWVCCRGRRTPRGTPALHDSARKASHVEVV